MVELRRIRKWVEEFINRRSDDGRDIKRAERRYYRGNSWIVTGQQGRR